MLRQLGRQYGCLDEATRDIHSGNMGDGVGNADIGDSGLRVFLLPN
jgi:hypothetical protein